MAVQAARRAQLLHRCVRQCSQMRREAMHLHRSFLKCAPWTCRCCARAGGRGGLRGAEMHDVFCRQTRRARQRTQSAGSKSLVFRHHILPEVKLLHVLKEAYLKSHWRNTLVTAASTELLQRNRRSGHTRQRAFSVRTAATSYDERSRCCPGPTVIRTRRGLPNTAHKKRPLRTTPPPR